MKILAILLAISVLMNLYLWWLHFKGTDKDKDGIDDRLEIKAKHVKKEIKDVKKAIKK